MTCGETSGFLFKHDCGHEAAANCQLCGKGICPLHTRTTDGQILCITCLKRYMAERGAAAQAPGEEALAGPGQPAGTAGAAGARRSLYAGSPWYSYDDPYWYTDRYYPAYHQSEFTREDRTAFDTGESGGGAAAEEAFETDKEAS